ncbi:Gfo/Idh/MocA family protein, partial [Fictibacillus sp. NRS-1165]|uniref:Gfo/Idh/MocA family protein n=1 Tax=Fictibacillus sp. NRS-1165 TaxID=3144463 RepID=UPI003D23FE50
VVAAYPGGSADFELSSSRVGPITRQLEKDFHVKMLGSPEEVAEQTDAILLTSVDGRVHLEQFSRVVPYGKPIYIDKPLACSSADARRIFDLAQQYNVPVSSSSSLRFSEELQQAAMDQGSIIGADTYGPMKIEPPLPGLFWYGIHSIEMLFTVMGTGCRQVGCTVNNDHDVIVGKWADGRIGTVRGNRTGNHQFGALVHRRSGTAFVDCQKGTKPHYASLLEEVMKMFTTGESPVGMDESMEVIRFIEAANESRQTGKTVLLGERMAQN